MCRGTRSYSMGGVPLCCFWPGIWASVVEKPRCVGSEVCPVAGGSLEAHTRKLYVDDPMLIAAGRGATTVSPKVEWVGGEFSLRPGKRSQNMGRKKTASMTFFKKHVESEKKQDKRAAREVGFVEKAFLTMSDDVARCDLVRAPAV